MIEIKSINPKKVANLFNNIPEESVVKEKPLVF